MERTATDSTQRALHQLTKHLSLVEKLVTQRLGHQEWAYYQTHRAEIRQLPQRLQELCTEVGGLQDFPSLVMEFEQFYTLASHRDHTLLKNFLRKLVESKDPQALVVTGGFHTQGVTERLRREGFSYVVFPKS
ncbi:MAG: hypothetical protein HYZ73_01855 [Elusimicrobia bacterium]|nr:hypothetical protein [Elusimicrobiota bacterium]